MEIGRDKGKLILVYMFLITLLLYIKPAMVFDNNGDIRKYGVGVDENGIKKTLFSFQLLVIFVAIIVFVLI